MEYLKLTVRVSVNIKNCNVELAPGMGIGCIASEDVTIIVPKTLTIHDAHIFSCFVDCGDELEREVIKQNYHAISVVPVTEDEYEEYMARRRGQIE